MIRITKWISLIERCGLQYRNIEFMDIGLNGTNHMYIFYLCRHPGVSQDELAKMLHINKSNVTRSLYSLETDGFIYKEVNKQDKRNYCIYPTDKAINTLPLIIEKMNKWNQLLMEGLSDEEQALLANILKQLANNACEYTNQILNTNKYDINGD